MRKGFSLITAIFVMVLMATLSLFILNLAGKVTQNTTTQFRHEQAALLARSYTELAVMSVVNHNRNTAPDCIQDINGSVNGLTPNGTVTGTTAGGSGYDVQTRIYYLGDTLPCAESRKLNNSTDATMSGTALTTNYNTVGAPDALAAIIVDVYVRYRNPISPTHWINFHRRTLQKI